MKILVIGGTYFLGKTFTDMAKDEHDIVLVNRGSRPAPDGVRSIICDRHDRIKLSEALSSESCQVNKEEDPDVGGFDAVVDFAAYRPGDIEGIVEALPGDVRGMRYIFISTSDVYLRGTGEKLDEDAPFERRDFGGETGAYILGKVALEEELTRIAERKGIIPTSIRPAFIYGEGNYAPRESMYFKWIKNASQFLHLSDADGFFQTVYVRDAAKAILNILGREDLKALNLCGDEVLNYERLAEVLEKLSEKCLGKKAERIDITVNDALERGIPFPYPMTKEESNYYISKYRNEEILRYTDFYDGLVETFVNGGFV